MEAWLEHINGSPEWMKLLILAASTLVSEDLTTISAGVLASQGSVKLTTAMLGCFLGIFVGDGLLYLVGLLIGKPALKLPILRNMLNEEKVNRCARWFEKNGMAVVLLSRFIPGTRLPTYFAAGMLGARARYFLIAAAVAVGVWTPLLIGAAWVFGDQVHQHLRLDGPLSWLILLLGVLLLFLGLRFLMRFTDWKFRRRLRSRLRRFIRWEFWPIAPIYLPIIFYNIWLAIRYRRAFLPLISNPGIDFSGYIGESKSDIMAAFNGQQDFLARFFRVPQHADPQKQIQAIEQWMAEQDIAWPIILKPDFGHRGSGVQKVGDVAAAEAYLRENPIPIHVQEMAPGPYEFGVSYRRFPGQEKGEIFGLTGKVFPAVAGDGKQSLEELILKLPTGLGRLHIFLQKYRSRLNEVLPEGSKEVLVSTGNHCLGTIFNDSSHLITEELNARFNEISNAIPGFYLGRYDVRAEDLEAFRLGQAFKIIELNGAAGEPSYMYDTRYGILTAWKTLAKQYRDLWAIGAANEAAGVKPISPLAFFRAIVKYREQSYKS